MMRRTSLLPALAVALAAGLTGAGCGTTRITETSRSATEQLLISQAIDRSVNQMDFSVLAGKTVYFEEKRLKGVTDEGYLASSLRSKMLADGCLVIEERAKATYVVEARSGCVGTDKHSLLVGVPQMNLPTIMPGQPPAIPEIPLMKTTDQKGIAKVAVFAYNRESGRAVWQSGAQESASRSKDSWVFGAGPFYRGTVKRGEGALDQLDVIGLTDNDAAPGATNGRPGVTQAAHFEEAPRPRAMEPVPTPALTSPPGGKPSR